MTVPWALVATLAQILTRHLNASMETAAVDAALLAKDLRRRLLATLFALAGAALCLVLGAAWIVGIAWNTPWRNPVLGTMLGAFALCALLGAVIASRPPKPGRRSPGNAQAFPRSTTMRLLLGLTAAARPPGSG